MKTQKPQSRRSLHALDRRRGRLLKVQGVTWKWRVSRGGGVVAYSETGEHRYSNAWTIKGQSPDTYERGQWKRTSDGSLTPKEVAGWLAPSILGIKRTAKIDKMTLVDEEEDETCPHCGCDCGF